MHIPGRICDHPQYFGLALLHFGYMRFAGAETVLHRQWSEVTECILRTKRALNCLINVK
jgi:hypothetical protein